MNVYLIFFKTVDTNYDSGQELIEARTKDEAVEVFRSLYPQEEYLITNIFKQIKI